jgi:hypothetical protein
MASLSRLPSRFPVGTKFVIEGHRKGQAQVFTRHLEFPDGTFVRLPTRSSGRRRRSPARKR